MVTAILPSMTLPRAEPQPQPQSRPHSSQANGHNVASSISSELTITPVRYQSSSSRRDTPDIPRADTREARTGQLAGLVGMFTGLGALLALIVFLPLPTRFQRNGASPSEAVADSFYVVGAVAIIVAIFCSTGLRNLPGEEHKGWRLLFGGPAHSDKFAGSLPSNGFAEDPRQHMSYFQLIGTSISLGFQDMHIGLGYLGGFVARASSVAISLFIPLFVNAYFISSGICDPDPDTPDLPADPGEIKRRCASAYVVAAKLTGTSQLVALICAPIFGYLSGHYQLYNLPLLLSAFAGIAGYTAFGLLKSPDPSSEDGNAGVYFIVALLGISQIGAIVCSLDLLGRGIQGGESRSEVDPEVYQHENGVARSASLAHSSTQAQHYQTLDINGTPFESPSSTPIRRRDSLNTTGAIAAGGAHESSPLLPSHIRRLHLLPTSSRAPLKGSIAGVYSLAGGAGILLLTKVGGLLFDRADVGSPFWLMAGFNGMLFIAGVVCGVVQWLKQKHNEHFIARHHELERDSPPVDAGEGG